MAAKVKLKNCPCCGGNAREYIDGGSLVVECHKCSLSIRRHLVPPSEWMLAAERCRECWNRRPKIKEGANSNPPTPQGQNG